MESHQGLVWVFALCASIMECKIPLTFYREKLRFQSNFKQVAGDSEWPLRVHNILHCGKTLRFSPLQNGFS